LTGITELKLILKQRGYKLTKQREAILQAFFESDTHLVSAQQLYNCVIANTPQTNFSTVYRNLEILVQESIVTKVLTQSKAVLYELAVENKHHHHLICNICGKVQSINYCPVDKISENYGFKHIDHRLEIFGLCNDCANIKQ